jgi:hypothetical protein
MYVVHGNAIVAYNDDYTGLASAIIYTPTISGSYRLIIRAYTTSTAGYCDLYQGVNGAPPSLLEKEVFFGGTYVHTRWKADEWFQTKNRLNFVTTDGFNDGGWHAEDPYLYLIYDGMMFWDDDGAGHLDSKIVPPSSGTGTVIVSSYSHYTEGECALALVNTSFLAPWLSPAPWSRKLAPVHMTDRANKYIAELQRLKPALERLSPNERDQKVLELQRGTLSEEEIRVQTAPRVPATLDFIRRQEQFLGQYKQLEPSLQKMADADRVERLVRLKRDTMGEEYSEPQQLAAPKSRS